MKSQRFVNGGSVMTLKNVTLTQSDSWVVKQNRYSLIRSNHPSSTSWMTTYTTVSFTCEYFKLLLCLDTLILFKNNQPSLIVSYHQNIFNIRNTSVYRYCKL